jgi:pimeloyl-ACP methyl ester carboxylesterase
MTDATRGAVILVHGGGVHPDWQQVIKPLRLSLPKKGWATLSIQMPVLPNAAEDRDYVAMFKYVPSRLKAAVEFLQQQNIHNIVLAGHSMGATMSSHYLAESQDKNIKAFIGVGMKGIKQPKKLSALDNSTSLIRINVPVLDVYGSHTNQEVLGSVDRRAFAIRSVGVSGSRQVFIKGADHFFERFETQLSEEVTNWLESVMPVSAASR